MDIVLAGAIARQEDVLAAFEANLPWVFHALVATAHRVLKAPADPDSTVVKFTKEACRFWYQFRFPAVPTPPAAPDTAAAGAGKASETK